MQWVLRLLSILGLALFLFVGQRETFHRLSQGSWGQSRPWVHDWLLGGVLLAAGTLVAIFCPKKELAVVASLLLLGGIVFSFQGLLS
ncbi:hypothetical protein [Armatimonas sp.]|uniref:hypothetical protein n=1 Tax=Armatimonas sp. TaxID=1872638 RepID=UPI00286B8957|nr:hypothetical protein [Armatimonas sp.]